MRIRSVGFLWALSTACGGSEVVCGAGTTLDDGVCLPEQPSESSGSTTVTGTTSETTSTNTGTSTTGTTVTGTTGTTSTSTTGTTPTSTTGTTGTTTTTGTGTTTTKPTDVTDNVVHVYLLGGQSNASGFGQVDSLPPSLQTSQDDLPDGPRVSNRKNLTQAHVVRLRLAPLDKKAPPPGRPRPAKSKQEKYKLVKQVKKARSRQTEKN